MEDVRRAWLTEQSGRLESLAGGEVTGWRGIEMAAREAAPGKPQSFDSGLPCLQLCILQADLIGGRHWQLVTYQNDWAFGLRVDDIPVLHDADKIWNGIYRSRSLPELPTGTVDAVSVRIEDDTISELKLTVATTQVLLLSGELHERWDGSLDWHRFDESILVFTEPNRADTVKWMPARATW